MLRFVPHASAAVLMLAAPPAAAQFTINPTAIVGQGGVVAAGQIARNNLARHRANSLPPAARAQAISSFAFRPDSGVRQQVYARAVEQMKRNSAADAAVLEKALTSGQMNRDMAGYLARYGMSVNNVADTTALYLAGAWLAARASTADPTRAQMIGLRNQVAATFASIPAFKTASSATKQDLSDANLVQTALYGTIASAAAKDPAIAARARPAIAKGVKSLYGLDILSMQLTDQGLR